MLSLTALFCVPKGNDDIILVYDLTDSVLNNVFWDPIFWMLLVYNVLDVTTHLSWFRDIYAAEMFHNYKMSESLQPYAGVDVYWEEKGGELYW